MKLFTTALIASALSIAAVPAFAVDIGGGFSLEPIADNCQLLTSTETGKPVIRVSPRGKWVFLIGKKKDCPKTYSGYPVLQMATAATQGYIFVGISDIGRKHFVRKKWGSRYIYLAGPYPKKPVK